MEGSIPALMIKLMTSIQSDWISSRAIELGKKGVKKQGPIYIGRGRSHCPFFHHPLFEGLG